MSYTDKDYMNAIKFALNYDKDLPITYSYKKDKDIYKVRLMDGGWYTINLIGSLVRNCLKWKGKRQWCANSLKLA